jgi:PAS domain S-box-containing protein
LSSISEEPVDQESGLDSELVGLEKYRTFFVQSGDPMQMLHDGAFIECNLATAVALGYESTGEFLNVHPAELSPEYQPDGKTSNEKAFEMMELAHANGTHRFEWIHKKKNGDEFPVEVMLTSVIADGEKFLYSVWTDISERKRVEEARNALEIQLRHSEKMKAVGQLAGGVAHDFNNLLQAMLGYAEISLERTGEDYELRDDIHQIIDAANKASELVGQLLAFGRRQVLSLDVLDLDGVIDDFTKMVGRIIGEHITFKFLTGPGIKTVCADRGQIEQIIMNLCVNGRDAMPEGGELMIKSETQVIDDNFCVLHTWAKPGAYVVLSISDSGIGMDEETQQRIFEPFFTSKKEGEGTGLGLSTVYGIVRQHDGMIRVESELGKGTTFNIYLPKSESRPTEPQAKTGDAVLGGNEVILLAEDDDFVRNASQRILESAGYTVLSAHNGDEALDLFRRREAEVDMAVLDVVMPVLGGRAALEGIRRIRPDVPVLFASGYSSSDIHTDFILDKGMQLIRKPYRRKEFLKKIREMLDS